MSTVSVVIGIAVATIIRMAVGTYWYSPVGFGKRWMKQAGIKPSDIKSEVGQRGIMGGILASIIIASVLMCFLYRLDVDNIIRGAWIGFTIWFGFVATSTIGGVLWEKRSLEWFVIVTGYDLVTYVLMGGVLALFN